MYIRAQRGAGEAADCAVTYAGPEASYMVSERGRNNILVARLDALSGARKKMLSHSPKRLRPIRRLALHP